MPSTYRLFSPLKLPRIGHFQHCHCLRSWTAFAQLKPYCIAECFVVFALHFSPRVVCDYLHPAKRSCPLRLKKSFALVVYNIFVPWLATSPACSSWQKTAKNRYAITSASNVYIHVRDCGYTLSQCVWRK